MSRNYLTGKDKKNLRTALDEALAHRQKGTPMGGIVVAPDSYGLQTIQRFQRFYNKLHSMCRNHNLEMIPFSIGEPEEDNGTSFYALVAKENSQGLEGFVNYIQADMGV